MICSATGKTPAWVGTVRQVVGQATHMMMFIRHEETNKAAYKKHKTDMETKTDRQTNKQAGRQTYKQH